MRPMCRVSAMSAVLSARTAPSAGSTEVYAPSGPFLPSLPGSRSIRPKRKSSNSLFSRLRWTPARKTWASRSASAPGVPTWPRLAASSIRNSASWIFSSRRGTPGRGAPVRPRISRSRTLSCCAAKAAAPFSVVQVSAAQGSRQPYATGVHGAHAARRTVATPVTHWRGARRPRAGPAAVWRREG